MKRIIITMVVAIIATLTMTSCAQQRMMASLKGDKEIETVYVSSAMMKMAGGLARHQMGWTASKFATQLQDVNCVEVASSEQVQGSKRIKDLAERLIKEHKLELLVEAEEDDESSQVYGLSKPDGSGFSLMLILNIEGNETNLVIIQGDFKS